MKICYDNLDDMKLTKNGVFLKKNRDTYIYMESCEKCGEPYLTLKCRPSGCCSHSCSYTGRVYSSKARKNMSKAKTGIPTKHGAYILNLPSYKTYADRLWCDKTGYKFVKDVKVLTVECERCKKMFVPKISNVIHRVRFLEGKETCESRFYCSDKCKAECPIFGQNKYPKGYKTPFEFNRYEYMVWRKEVMRRAKYRCEYCGEKAVDTHHIKSKKLEPFFALDPDYGIACCESCHYKYGHSGSCATVNMANKICI